VSRDIGDAGFYGKRLMDHTARTRYGRITEEGVAEVRARIGRQYPIREPFLRYINADSIRHVAHGIGDPNPLWTDPEHAASTRYGRLVAPPALLYGVAWSAWDMRRGEGLPGVHGLHAGDAWTYFRPLLAGDEVRAVSQLVALDERDGRFAGRSYMQVRRFDYFDQDDALVARCDMSAVRAERDAGRERGEKSGVALARYSPEDIERIEALYDAEEIRGSIPRLWDDVAVGDSIGSVVKGPLTVTDMISWTAAVGSPHVRSGQFWLAYRRRSPRIAVIDPETGIPDTIERVHWDPFMASEIGMSAPYDYGSQRGAWSSHLLTNWCGDDGHLTSLAVQYRGLVYLGDTLVFSGSVTDRWRDHAGGGHVECEIQASTQRGDVVLKGTASVALRTAEGVLPVLPLEPEALQSERRRVS